jgi:hypothetical protein
MKILDLDLDYVDPSTKLKLSDLIVRDLPVAALLDKFPAENVFMLYANSSIEGASNKAYRIFNEGLLDNLFYQDPNNGRTVLHVLIQYNNVDLVQKFLDQIDDVPAFLQMSDIYGDTPLHIAVDQGAPDIVAYLISKGADVNAKNRNGQTALHLITAKSAGTHANKEKIYEIADLLLKAHADQDLADAEGKTAIQYLNDVKGEKEFNDKLRDLFSFYIPEKYTSSYPKVAAPRPYNAGRPKRKMEGGRRSRRKVAGATRRKLKSRRRKSRRSRR